MKIRIMKSVLLGKLITAAKATSNKGIIPILSAVKLEVTSEDLRITGSDSTLYIQTRITTGSFEMIRPGTAVLAAKAFVEIIKKVPADREIEIEVGDSHHATIKFGRSEMELSGYDPSEYPKLDVIGDADPIVLKAQTLKKMLAMSTFAISDNDSDMPAITGCLVEINEGMIKLTSTNRSMLARVQETIPQAEEISVIIPGSSVKELQSVLDGDEDVRIFLNDRMTRFEIGNITLHTNLIEGKYPQVTDKLTIPPDGIRATFNTHEFLSVIDRAMITAGSEEAPGKKLVYLELSKQETKISSRSDAGKTQDYVSPIKYEGDEIKIAFNAKYLMQVLDSIGSDEVTFHLTSHRTPIFLTGPARTLYMVLPFIVRSL